MYREPIARVPEVGAQLIQFAPEPAPRARPEDPMNLALSHEQELLRDTFEQLFAAESAKS